MVSEFHGVGWEFPVTLDDGGQVGLARYDESIRQSIWMILGTARGERVMRPDFGCGIHDLVFAVNDAGTAGRVVGEVRRSLLQWEPRIDVEDLSASPVPEQPNLLRIEIGYKVRATNSKFNLVYPFYLE